MDLLTGSAECCTFNDNSKAKAKLKDCAKTESSFTLSNGFKDDQIITTISSCREEEVSPKSSNYTRRQIFTLITLAYGNFWVAACVSLQAPFFPKEAESKGATPTQYGLVFGIYELVICITSPIFGKVVSWISPNFICEAGLFLCGSSTVLFGILDHAPYGSSFITLAFVIRIVEGVSAAAFMTASYCVMASEFPDRVATTFSLLETCFGLGLILGPTLGGAIYEIGGFLLPFASLGFFLLLGSVVIYFLMPESGDIEKGKSGNLTEFLSDPGIILDSFGISTSLNFIGFNAATLEPHLRKFGLSPIIIGCIFVIIGGIYAFTTPVWGKLCDKGYDPKTISAFGCFLCCVGMIFIGPVPFLDISTTLWLVIVSLFFIGLGIAAKLVSAFVNALHDSIKRRGFPDDMSTYGLVSALFFSSCSIGACIGPSLGGILLEKVGFRQATLVVLSIDFILLILTIIYIIYRKLNNSLIKSEKEPLLRRRKRTFESFAGSNYSKL